MFKSFIKLAVLRELAQEERCGYDLLLACNASKKVSAGYIYPLLQDLWKTNYISLRIIGRKKLYKLTSKGRKLLTSLEQKHSDLLEETNQILSPLFEESDFAKFVSFRKDCLTHKSKLLHDADIYVTLHRAIFAVYDKNNSNLTRKMRSILSQTIKRIGALH